MADKATKSHGMDQCSEYSKTVDGGRVARHAPPRKRVYLRVRVRPPLIDAK
jgi:hypothetical protein